MVDLRVVDTKVACQKPLQLLSALTRIRRHSWRAVDREGVGAV